MRIPCVCVVALLSAVSSAQTTHIVGPGGFAQVNQALAVAAPGDEIVVQPGLYQPFSVTFGATIRAQAPGTVTFDSSWIGPGNQVSLSAGQAVHLVDLKLMGVAVSGGVITMDRCDVSPAYFYGGTVRATSCVIALQECTMRGVGSPGLAVIDAALHATNAHVAAFNSTFTAGSSINPELRPHPGVGIYLNDSTLNGSFLTITGGNGDAWHPPQAGIAASNSSLWLSDSNITGGGYSGASIVPIACAVLASSGRLDRCVLAPSTCMPGIPTTGPLLSLHRAGPMTSPGAAALAVRAAANQAVGVYLSTGLGYATVPLLEQPILLDVANAVPFALVVTDAVGQASAACAIPAGLTGLEFWFQGVSGVTLPLQLSPVGGGFVRAASGPMAITQVDPASAAAGAAIAVIGTSFAPGLSVTVNGTPIAPTSVSATQIVFPYPAGIPCDAQLSVASLDGQVATAVLNPTPVVTVTLSGGGTSAGGQSFFLLGSGFSPGTTVTIGGVAATMLSAQATAMLVRTPPGTPGPATVVITTPGGCTTTTTYTYR